MTIAIILSLSLTAYSQDTETREVKVSVLKAMGKDLEKCHLLQNAYDLKSNNLDSILKINIKLFTDLESYQNEQMQLRKELEVLNEKYLNVKKDKKAGWLVPGLVGVIGGLVLGFSL